MGRLGRGCVGLEGESGMGGGLEQGLTNESEDAFETDGQARRYAREGGRGEV